MLAACSEQESGQAVTAEPVAAKIQRDPVEPRRKFGLPPKFLDSAKSPKESFLAHIPRILLASDHSVGKGKDLAFPTPNKLVEAVRVTSNRECDEFFVSPLHANSAGITFAHDASRTS